jgi:hypothetical protein
VDCGVALCGHRSLGASVKVRVQCFCEDVVAQGECVECLFNAGRTRQWRVPMARRLFGTGTEKESGGTCWGG